MRTVCLISIKSLEENFQLVLLLHSSIPLKVFSYDAWKQTIYPHVVLQNNWHVQPGASVQKYKTFALLKSAS